MAKPKKADKPEEKYLQYAVRGGIHTRCGVTVQTLEPGFYDVVDAGFGNFGMSSKEMVSDELIDIPGTIVDEIYKDVDLFLSTKDAYSLYGLTHKRGYLFYGPPGSGKTSLGVMLGRRFVEKVGGVVAFCPSFQEFYHGVSIMRDVEPGRPSMYLIEEADAIINNPACLSILDGELSIQGAVFVAMTNYKDKMPPRITNRPGRFDRVERVDCPPEPVQLEYLRRVEARGGKNPHAPEAIVGALRGLPVSLAHLREAFISHVMMQVPLDDLRTRFELMCGLRDDKTGELIEDLFKEPEEPNDDDDDYERQCMIDDAQMWEPEEPNI